MISMSETLSKIVIQEAILHTVVVEGEQEAALTLTFHVTDDRSEKTLTILQRERVGKGGNPRPHHVGPDMWRFDEEGFLIWLAYKITNSYSPLDDRGVKLNELINKKCFAKCSSANAVRNVIQRWKSDPPEKFTNEEKFLWYLRSEMINIRGGVVGLLLPEIHIEPKDLEFLEIFTIQDPSGSNGKTEDLTDYTTSNYQIFVANIMRSVSHSFERDKITKILKRYGVNDFSDYNDWLNCLEILAEIGLQMDFDDAIKQIDNLEKAIQIPNLKKKVNGKLFEEIHDIRFSILFSRLRQIKGDSEGALNKLKEVRDDYDLDKDDTRNQGVLQLKAEALVELSRAMITKANFKNIGVEEVRLVKNYLDRARTIYKLLRSIDGIMTVNYESVGAGISLMEKNIVMNDNDKMRMRYKEAKEDLEYALALKKELNWSEPYGYLDFNAAYLYLYIACIDKQSHDLKSANKTRQVIKKARGFLSSALSVQKENKSILMCARSQERLSLSFLLEIALMNESDKWNPDLNEVEKHLQLARKYYGDYHWNDKVDDCDKDLGLLSNLNKKNLSEAVRESWSQFEIADGFLGLSVALGLPANKA